MVSRFIKLVFFGNYFYAACAVALSVEASMQMGVPLNPWFYYLLVATATVFYYTKAYISESGEKNVNARTAWYRLHKQQAKISQVVLAIVTVTGAVYYLLMYYQGLFRLSLLNWLGILTVPVAAILYYGLSWKRSKRYNLRKNGFLKPFVIGFVWAGAVTIYPVVFKYIQSFSAYEVSIFSLWLLAKNWMFITVLCIMFDIKDYAADHNRRLKTFVVRVGLRKTIFYIIIPLCLAGWLAFLVFAYFNSFAFFRVIINSIPFLLLLLVAYSLHRRKSILYYLIIIDGLMLVKAACGIMSVIWQ
ncbi:hypothetical protein [Foetidibacter luteolus]|uniref:hypothetical protein n=1 Tax=Foetidibacter luteolus TaxID=2608880 RepID=UPI00129B32EB|nr:hypothetical protein [Foetidibacter luteolus]